MKISHHTPPSSRSTKTLPLLCKQPLLSGGVRAVWLAGVGCWALIAVPSLVTAAPAAKTAGKGAVKVNVSAKMQDRSSRGATYNLPMGRVLHFQPPAGFQYRVEEGAEAIELTATDGKLAVKPQRLGRATIVVNAPNAPTQTYLVRVVDAAPAAGTSAAVEAAPVTPAAEAAAPVTVAPVDVAPAVPVDAAPAVPVNEAASVPVTAPVETTMTTPVEKAAVPASTLATTPVAAPVLPAGNDNVQLSPAVRIPARLPAGREPFPTRSQLPRIVANQQASAARNTIAVSQGLARLLRFNSNILAVFYSDVNVMDARAVNARTVALTGLGGGVSTLAVFSERFPGDAVGKANIYQIEVRPQGASGPAVVGDPETVAGAIRTALGDPRISVSVLQTPGGSLAVRLGGVVRDQSEIEAARTTAALFVPQVISSLYVDKDSSRPGESSGEQLQARLRQVSGNETIEVIALPNGLTLKAVVASPGEAQSLLALIPLATSQKVMPFIVLRNAAGGAGDIYNGPTLTAEDQDMTRRLKDVTGIDTVYVVRTAENGLAVYGTVRNRSDYDSVRRFAIVLPQLAKGAADKAIPNDLPTAGNQFPTGVQLFVRILDESAQAIRVVTADTNIVEINRTALKNLGIEYGSAQVLSESIDGGGETVVVNPVTGAENRTITAPSITRTLDPTFRPGEILAGNGFAGFGNRGLIDPVRLRVNALYQKGDVRILSNPNITAAEGTEAQIVIGGSRPIPQALTVGGAGGSSALQNVIFRKYGIILTMRPTVTDDDTIFLQIRADVTALDPTTATNINGALIPGETVRSVDTTLTVKEGDVVIMGGLVTNDRSMRTSRVPILSDLPIFGSLFKSKRFENNQSELAIFMTPRIRRVQVSPNTLASSHNMSALPELPGIQSQNTLFSDSTDQR